MTETKVALVTGAARGIGRAIAARLLAEHWAVALVDVDETVRETAARLAAAGGAARAWIADIGEEAAVGHAVAAVADWTGRLDALVNNAGVNVRRPLERLSVADWQRVIATNLTGAFLCTRAAVPWLRPAGGAVVNIASTRALMSEPDTEAYAASKGGLVALTHAMAVSLGPAVRVNAISPGWIFTKGTAPDAADHDFHPAGRVGTADDVAELAAYLLGPRAGFVTGANFVVDGGVTRKMIYPE